VKKEFANTAFPGKFKKAVMHKNSRQRRRIIIKITNMYV
jgi:hypothetical protein